MDDQMEMTDDHDIGHLSGDHEEHLAAIDLATEADATHVAIASGDWFDPSIWDGGVVPGDDARVFIPEHFEVDYAGGDGARIFTIGVEGALRFDPEADSQLIVDTLIVAPGGKLEVGTDDAPVTGAVDIVIANNGAIDVDWDPQLLSRGIVSLGDVSIHGTEVQSHVKVAVDPMAGDTTLTLALSDIEGWSVGDVIVVAGTDNPGHSINAYDREYRGDTNETRTIVAIDGDTVTLDQPLDHDHATPRADLKTSVANMSRSITIRSEDGAESAVHERGHVMFMGSDDVEVRFASFEDLGRTDKSVRSAPATSFEDIAFDSNAQGRYSLHLHKLGVENQDEPIWVEGNSVTGSPGWGIVQHSSNANLHNNAVIDVFASSFVSEAGDETGTWSNNISLGNIGMLGIERDHADVAAGDLARTGSGFWLQSRLVDVVENIAVATRTGFVWIAQGSTEEVDASLLDQPESLGFGETVSAQQQAISLAQDNEVFGSERGMTVTKGHPNQNHDIRSVMDGFTAWEVRDGVKAIYTAHYTYKNFDLIAVTEDDPLAPAGVAFLFANNAADMVVVDPKIQGFEYAYEFTDFLSPSLNATQADKQFFVVGGELSDLKEGVFVENGWEERTTLIDLEDIEIRTPTVDVTSTKIGEDYRIFFTGTRYDSLGEGPIPAGTDDVYVKNNDIRHIVLNDGYFTRNGEPVVIVENYYQDRLTGEMIKVGHVVEFADPNDINSSYYIGKIYLGELPEDNAAAAPVDDTATTTERTAVEIDVLSNDSDPDGDAFYVDGTVQPIHGEVDLTASGALLYTPDAGFIGADRFEYWVTDGFGEFEKAEVVVTVEPALADAGADSDDDDGVSGDAGDGQDDDRDTDSGDTDSGDSSEDDAGDGDTGEATGGEDAGDPLGEDTPPGDTGVDEPEDDADGALDGPGDDDTMNGGQGDDEFMGLAGDDLLRGYAGDDTLHGGQGEDMLRGGADDDLLRGGGGDDYLLGGQGADLLRGGVGEDTLKGGLGDDLLKGQAGDDHSYGGGGADILRGGRGEDALFGGGGEDTLSGGFGDDILKGRGGDDLAHGGGGDDIMRGGQGDDRLYGGAGADTLNGGQGDDLVKGQAGDDLLAGGGGADALNGGAGDDKLNGGVGADILYGGGGADTLNGGRGDDVLFGDGGDDVFVLSSLSGDDIAGDFTFGEDVISAAGRSFTDIVIEQAGADAVIRLDDASLTLRDADAADLSANDFMF